MRFADLSLPQQTALSWFSDSVRYAAEHVPHAQVRELGGAGHLAPIVEPRRVATELVRFFDGAA